MSRARTRTAKVMPKKARLRARSKSPALPVSLPPPASPEPTSLPSVTTEKRIHSTGGVPEERDWSHLPSNALLRQKVLAIISMRVAGKSTDEIAETLHVKPATIRQYMWIAGKNGWLARRAVDPTDRLEYEIAHKVVRNLDEMLDSDNEGRRDLATMKTAEGVLFKKFGDAAQAAPLAVIGIKIEMPAGPAVTIREGTTGGTMRWVEGEVSDGEKP